ncbi:hypothetical protein S7335_1193 [Synechococcus sp. PCC 7335]|uniref:hypothetical protein n=1 Tax=Synechococcus sp. (strain ATCC 29403 / PCC 7335) TaxID=91464 RepID=UPI00017EB56D|nr:hypothetical protein [Synechococcus sp. PCC 7335]EDX82489.1 hypothetical protein S7335_1193 [Synechococcus sp. PCC 7335]
MAGDISGTEKEHRGNTLVPIGGKLPHYLELRTSATLDCLQTLIPSAAGKRNRQRLNASLASRTRLGLYLEINEKLHLAYADQRDGRGSQHWWRLFFDDSLREIVERAANAKALAVGTQSRQEEARHTNQGVPSLCWSGMYFRSKAELAIAKALQTKEVLFFANSQGMASLKGLPVTRDAHGMVERLEADFLVFRDGQCICLEVDGRQHQQSEYAFRDYAKERALLKEQIPTVRFPAQECIARPQQVVEEFLALFPIS